MLERMDLQKALGWAIEIEGQAQAVLHPYQAAFEHAHGSLVSAKAANASAETCRPLYDARMLAGYKRHPFKREWEAAAAWRKEIVKELAAVNKEIGS